MEYDAGKNFLAGQEAQTGLVQKAYALEKQRVELEQQKQQVAIGKFQMVDQEMRSVLAMPKEFRPAAIEGLRQKATIAGIPMDPGVLKLLESDDYQSPLLSALNHGYSETDPAKQAEYANQFFGATGDLKTAMGALQAWQEHAAKKKSNAPSAADTLKLTNETINTVKGTTENPRKTIEIVNNMFALGNSPESRSSAVAKDAIKVFLAKLSDPTSVAREGEVARVTGLGANALDKVEQMLDNIVTGNGKLNDKQWKLVLQTADILGKGAQQDLDAVKGQRSSELTAAGVNPESVFGSFPRLKEFNFDKHFGASTAGKRFKQAATDLQKDKQKIAQDGWSEEQQKKIVETLKAKHKENLTGGRAR